MSGSKSYTYNDVVTAVLKVGSNKWNLIGLALGLTDGEISSAASDKPTNAGKLQAIISKKRDELGEKKVARMLLEACRTIPEPIIGSVLQHLDPTYNPGANVVTIADAPGKQRLGPVAPVATVTPTSEANEQVTATQLWKLATAIEGFWDVFAMDLDPELFSMAGNLNAIKTNQNYGSPRIKAQAMLETWKNAKGGEAKCFVLIKALCSGNHRQQAYDVFGITATDSVVPLKKC